MSRVDIADDIAKYKQAEEKTKQRAEVYTKFVSTFFRVFKLHPRYHLGDA